MIGDKMTELATYLKSKNIFNKCKFDVFMGTGEILPAGKNLGNDRHIIVRVKYPAIYFIENWRDKTAALIPVLVTTWLGEHDCDRYKHNLPFPTFTPAQLNERDSSLVDLEFEIEFQEDVTIVPDENGLIDYLGKTYSIAPIPDADTAIELGDVGVKS